MKIKLKKSVNKAQLINSLWMGNHENNKIPNTDKMFLSLS